MSLAGISGLILAVLGIWALYARETIGTVPLLAGLAGLLISAVTISLALRYFHQEDSGRPAILTHKPTLNAVQLIMIATGLAGIAWALFLAGTVHDFFASVRNGIGLAFLLIAGVFFIYFAFDVARTSAHPEFRKHKSGLADYLLVFLLPFLIGGASAWKLYNQEAETASAGEPDYKMSPAQLIAEFEKNDTAANAKYIGKSVRFAGTVTEISGDSGIMVKMSARKGEYTVNCNFDRAMKEKLTSVLAGDSLEVQCSCSGVTVPDEEMSMLSESSLDMTRCNLIKWHQHKPNIGTDVEHPEGKDTIKK